MAQNPLCCWCGGRRRDRRARAGVEGLAAVPVGGGGAWPGFETTRRAEGSQRGRLAGGPPPTGTQSNPAGHSKGPEAPQRLGPLACQLLTG